MSGDLSRSLVDAAAEAVRKLNCPHESFKDYGDNGCMECEARVAVAAVLETLAAHCDPVAIGDGGTSQALLSNTELRQLAAEARED